MLVAWLGIGCATMAPDFSAEEFPESAPNTQPVKDSSPPTSLADRPASSEERIRDKTLEPDTIKVPVWEPETAIVEGGISTIKAQEVLGVTTPVRINVEGMRLQDFITYTLGKVLKVTFFLEEEVRKGKAPPITLRMPRSLPPDVTLNIIVGLLEKNRLFVQEKNGALYISQMPEGAGRETGIGREVRGDSGTVNQLVPLKYIRPQTVSRLLSAMYKGLVDLDIFPKKNAVVIWGPREKVKTAIQFIDALDIPLIRGKIPILLKLTYWDIDTFIPQLTMILKGIGFPVATMPSDPGVLFVPLKTFNGILVLAPDKHAAQYIEEWTKQLDTPSAVGSEEKTFTYSPKFSKASNLVEVLEKVYGKGADQGLQGRQALESTGTGSRPAQVGMQKGPPGSEAARALSRASSLLDAGIRVTADDLRNLLIVVATPANYESLLNFLQKLDIPARQVLIEVTLAEITLDDQFQFGIEWAIRNQKIGDGLFGVSTLGQLGLSTGTGLTSSFVLDSNKFEAILNAFASVNKLNVLSTPRLMVLDNQEANINIGDEVPIISSEVSATDLTGVIPTINRNIEMRQTGILLRIKPTINTKGLLTLDIALELSDARATTTSDINSPTIFTRRIRTSVVVGHGKSVFLGGLISETIDEVETKVPFLGDIPYVGQLFKTQSSRTRKTELIVLIKPTILTNLEEAQQATQEIKDGLTWFEDGE